MAGFDDMMQQMRRMQEDMNRVMMRSHGGGSFSRDPFNTMALMDTRDPFFGSPALTGGPVSGTLAIPQVSMPLDVFKPQMDVIDMGDHFAVRADLPGMQKQDVKVDVKDGMLNILAEHKEDKKRTEGNWVVQERRFGKFQRSLRLPENVKEETIKAKFTEGVLELDLPKLDKTEAGKAITIS
eukprot:GHVS01011706.1.p1 GENE.GHVS01011706.1~~GHVS01011706.1.p1  ORF type:complete len:182 (+),score=39.92 GHVS01011706.1:485-1030(+)